MQDETVQTTGVQKIKVKRTTKNSVFLDLFNDKKNLLALYKAIHPEDIETTENSLTNVTIENVLTDNLYNDLGFIANNKLMILIEAQSTWTMNILVRILLYLAESYHKYFEQNGQNLYGSRKVKMPKPELYVIFTGNRGRKPDVISLSKEFFDDTEIDVEVKAKVIYESDGTDIINQYIVFCKVLDEQRGLYGMTEQAIKETIRICKDRNVLKEYFESRETEVVTIMMSLFDDERIMKTALKSERHEADRATAEIMIRGGEFSLEKISRYFPNLTMEELKEIEVEVMLEM